MEYASLAIHTGTNSTMPCVHKALCMHVEGELQKVIHELMGEQRGDQ